MKCQTLLLGTLLTQAWVLNVAAKPLSLYRIEGSSVTNNEKNTRQLTNNVQIAPDTTSSETVLDFSNELYDDTHIPKERTLYQDEIDKLVKERRDMFTRNLVSMSVSLSFAVIIAPAPEPSLPEPIVMESGDENESSYDVLREKLLGEDANDQGDEENINQANELASSGEGKVSGLMLTEIVETETDYAVASPAEGSGYVSLRQKLLGKGDDEEFEDTVDQDVKRANNLASKSDILGGGPKKNLRRR